MTCAVKVTQMYGILSVLAEGDGFRLYRHCNAKTQCTYASALQARLKWNCSATSRATYTELVIVAMTRTTIACHGNAPRSRSFTHHEQELTMYCSQSTMSRHIPIHSSCYMPQNKTLPDSWPQSAAALYSMPAAAASGAICAKPPCAPHTTATLCPAPQQSAQMHGIWSSKQKVSYVTMKVAPVSGAAAAACAAACATCCLAAAPGASAWRSWSHQIGTAGCFHQHGQVDKASLVHKGSL